MAKVMIGVDHGSYSFNAASSQVTINLEDNMVPILESILLITNVTDNIIIYNFANPILGGTLSSNVLTLDYSTVAMSNSDSLQIWYYVVNPQEINDSAVTTINNTIASNGAYPDVAGRMRVVIDTASSMSTVSTVSTVTSVTNLAQIGGNIAILHMPSIMQTPIEMQMQKIIVT